MGLYRVRYSKGLALLESILSSALIVMVVYAATSASLSLSTLDQSVAGRDKIGQAVKEYSYILYQYAGDLNIARDTAPDVWANNLQTFCQAMVTQQRQASSGEQADTVFTLWNKNFNSDASTLNFKLDGCDLNSSAQTPGLVFITLNYSWNALKNAGLLNQQDNTGRQTDSMYISVYKPL
ncbi:hypothetical protein NQT62_12850 [Limnobacter humi]|uniref:Type II secretion system protein n=1 Tax=Limnobacter humi TaxID=1778671 RepID=A0ABT1WKD3_9BURK|nr:hypothetical protein [Limnobacter humi]MCQ8897322.1 hypothetical protein [Limnobacter humi]